MPPSIRLTDLKSEYQNLWDTCQIRPDRLTAIAQIVEKIIRSRDRYTKIQDQIKVPWTFVAVVHNMESSLNFSKHLHNGDSLTCKTKNVPANRPSAEPVNGWIAGYTWEESVIDALTGEDKDLDKVKDWSIAAQLWQLERYNGFGYRLYHPEVRSPYLWSGTNHYSKGKYTADGKWNANAISEQIGAAALLKIFSVVGI